MSRSVYHEQLARYYARFPRERLLVLSSEQLFAEPSVTLERVFEFLEVDPRRSVADLRPVNVGTNRTKVEPRVYSYLEDFFKPHNQRLFELINQRFAWSS